MSDKKFWKIVYLYVTKYSYEVIHYRPEKQDVWLINNHNELIRFIYTNSEEYSEVEASVYNIINNKNRLKKVFKLNSLKIKMFYISPATEYSSSDYKKYKVSDDLLIERVLLTDNNTHKFINTEDENFLDIDVDSDRYKNRIIEEYKSKESGNYNLNVNFSAMSIVFILLFSIRFLIIYISNSKIDIYSFINYNYQEIISGNFYRLLTGFLIFENLTQLVIVSATIILCSILLGEDIKLRDSIIILSFLSVITNLFIIFDYLDTTNVVDIVFFGLLGSVFVLELNRRTNSIKFIYALLVPILYLLVSTIFLNVSLGIYIFSFILGLFIQLLLSKQINIWVSLGVFLTIILSGAIIVLFNLDFKGYINNHSYNRISSKIENPVSMDTAKLEKDILTTKKSVITYYQVAYNKLYTSSISEAKRVFLEGVEFDNSFSPFYYQLALIERGDSEYEKALEYTNKALELEPENEKYLNLKEELNKNIDS